MRVWLLLLVVVSALSLKGQERMERAPKAQGAAPDTVYMGAYFVWVYDFNLPDESYSVKCWLWFRYTNPALQPEKLAAVFNAKSFEFTHVVHQEINGVHWVQMNCTAVVRQKYLLKYFPFDKQVLRFRVGFEGSTDHDIVLVADTTSHSVYDEFNQPEGWNLVGFSTVVEPRTYQTDFGTPVVNGNTTTLSLFMAQLKLERQGWSLFLKLFSGMYAAFLIAWFSLFINPSAVDPRFGLSVGGLFATVGNKYIVDSILPEMTKDNLVDTLHGYTFAAVISCICISVISLYYQQRGLTKRYKRVDRIASLVLLLFFVVINVVLISQSIQSSPANFWPAK